MKKGFDARRRRANLVSRPTLGKAGAISDGVKLGVSAPLARKLEGSNHNFVGHEKYRIGDKHLSDIFGAP